MFLWLNFKMGTIKRQVQMYAATHYLQHMNGADRISANTNNP